jgi:hypothetical protein
LLSAVLAALRLAPGWIAAGASLLVDLIARCVQLAAVMADEHVVAIVGLRFLGKRGAYRRN